MTTPAFLTGSHAYGTPHEGSDVDLVVFMSEDATYDLLDAMGIKEDNDGYSLKNGYQFKAGKLNIIICTREDDYLAWSKGTTELRKVAPVTRAEAVRTLKANGAR